MKREHSYVAISAIWYERFLECSRTFGTDEFVKSVWRFYHSLLNLDADDLAIYTKVTSYLNEVWNPNFAEVVKENTRFLNDISSIEHERDMIEAQLISELYHFIIQTIQDSGIGWTTREEMQKFNISQE